jgi:hypothetical protein
MILGCCLVKTSIVELGVVIESLVLMVGLKLAF